MGGNRLVLFLSAAVFVVGVDLALAVGLGGQVEVALQLRHQPGLDSFEILQISLVPAALAGTGGGGRGRFLRHIVAGCTNGPVTAGKVGIGYVTGAGLGRILTRGRRRMVGVFGRGRRRGARVGALRRVSRRRYVRHVAIANGRHAGLSSRLQVEGGRR
jgi:hypothetical protein